jgi:hypothetical protein
MDAPFGQGRDHRLMVIVSTVHGHYSLCDFELYIIYSGR